MIEMIVNIWLQVKKFWWLALALFGLSLFQAERAPPSTTTAVDVVQAAPASTDSASWLVAPLLVIITIICIGLLYRNRTDLWKRSNGWVLAVLVFAIAAGYGLYTNNWDVWAEWQGVPVVLLATVLPALGLMLFYTDWADLRAVLIMTGIICTAFAVYELYSHGMIGFGMRRNVAYAVIIVLALTAGKYLTKNIQKFVATVLVLTTFVMLGFSHFDTWGQFTGRFQSGSGPGIRQVTLAVPQVPQVKKLWVTLGSSRMELKPDGYDIAWHEEIPGQCVHVYTPGGQYLGNDCNGRNLNVKNAPRLEFASASGVPVLLSYTLTRR